MGKMASNWRLKPGMCRTTGVECAEGGYLDADSRRPRGESSPPRPGADLISPVMQAMSLQSPWGLPEERHTTGGQVGVLEDNLQSIQIGGMASGACGALPGCPAPWDRLRRDLDDRLAVVASTVVRPSACPPRCRCEVCSHVRRMRVEGPVSWYCKPGCRFCGDVDRDARGRMDEFMNESRRGTKQMFKFEKKPARTNIFVNDVKTMECSAEEKIVMDDNSSSSATTIVADVQDETVEIEEKMAEEVVCEDNTGNAAGKAEKLTKSMKKRMRLKKKEPVE